MKQRARIVPRASGDVLELGCGGGTNLALYDRLLVRSLSGIDPSPELLTRTYAEAARLGIDADIRAGIGEAMPFADASFDTVLTTFTLCSVQDPVAVMAEMRRVLRPEGRILFLEHGHSPDPGPARWQHRVEPVWKRIAGGCHLTRPVADGFAAAGFTITQCDKRYLPKTPRFLGWVEGGEARP